MFFLVVYPCSLAASARTSSFGRREEQAALHYSPRFRHQTPTVQSAYQFDKATWISHTFFFPLVIAIMCTYSLE